MQVYQAKHSRPLIFLIAAAFGYAVTLVACNEDDEADVISARCEAACTCGGAAGCKLFGTTFAKKSECEATYRGLEEIAPTDIVDEDACVEALKKPSCGSDSQLVIPDSCAEIVDDGAGGQGGGGAGGTS